MIQIETKIISIEKNIQHAVSLGRDMFLEGRIFIYPTDTIYGIGGNPFNEDVVERIQNIKGRNTDKRFIYLIDSIETLLRYADFPFEEYIDFLKSIWPNHLTAIVKLKPSAQNLFGQHDAAFRIPDNHFCQKLLSTIKMPLISTSVNRSGQHPLFDSASILNEFRDEVDAVFYQNGNSLQEASTIISLVDEEIKLVRAGKIPFGDILNKFEEQKSE